METSRVGSLSDQIRRKKQRKKWKHEKLINKLESKRQRILNEEKLSTAAEDESRNKIILDDEKRQLLSTISVALPGSILDNAQSPELRSYLAGQIARALAMFSIDEIIVYNDKPRIQNCAHSAVNDTEDDGTAGSFSGVGISKHGQGSLQLGRLLQYLECPQYLRKYIFPLHSDLKFAGLLNPTDMPHHLRASQTDVIYREGIVLDRPLSKYKKNQIGSLVDIGINKECVIDRCLTPGIRVTVRLPEDHLKLSKGDKKLLRGIAVSPREPLVRLGLYWGYTIRMAASLSDVFNKCTYEEGYTLTIGTSERGSSVDKMVDLAGSGKKAHILIVFGGLGGIEESIRADETLQEDDAFSVVKDPSLLFDHYINTLPNQGSRTIRTEEALLITLSILRPKLANLLNKA